MALTTSTTSPDAQPFFGFVETTGDALRLVQAARLGLIPRVTRRLNDAERRVMVRSGAVFIFNVEESGIKRWTEGLLWSASRIVGNFLVYREVSERGSGRASYGKSYASSGGPSSRRLSHLSPDQQSKVKFEKTLYGSLLDHHGRFKEEGLIKKTITVRVEGQDHHLVSYYKKDDIESGLLQRPTVRAAFRDIVIPHQMLEETSFRYPPKVERSKDGSMVYIRDADEPEGSPISPVASISSGRRRLSIEVPPIASSSSAVSPGPPNSRQLPWLPDLAYPAEAPPSAHPDPYHPSPPEHSRNSHSPPHHSIPHPQTISHPIKQQSPIVSPLTMWDESSQHNYHQPPPQQYEHASNSQYLPSEYALLPDPNYRPYNQPTNSYSSLPAEPTPTSYANWPYMTASQTQTRWNSDPQVYASANRSPLTVDHHYYPSSPHGSQYSAPTPSPLSLAHDSALFPSPGGEFASAPYMPPLEHSSSADSSASAPSRSSPPGA